MSVLGPGFNVGLGYWAKMKSCWFSWNIFLPSVHVSSDWLLEHLGIDGRPARLTKVGNKSRSCTNWFVFISSDVILCFILGGTDNIKGILSAISKFVNFAHSACSPSAQPKKFSFGSF